MKKSVFALTVMLVALGSCQKDDNTNNNNNNTGNSSVIPSDANGAFYAKKTNQEITELNWDTGEEEVVGTQDFPGANAWFGSYTSTQNAGTVTVNGEALANNLSGVPLPMYNYYGSNFEMFPSSAAQWVVEGSGTVQGFSHTDNAVFPTVSIVVPSTININSSYTLTLANLSPNNNEVLVAIGVTGGQQVIKKMAAGVTSATFTSAELHSVAPSAGYSFGVSATVTKYTSATYNGKKYYFLKQYEVTRNAVAE